MKPNLAGVSRVIGRIEEIERKIRSEKKTPQKEEQQERFVEVLQREEDALKENSGIVAARKAVIPGIVPGDERAEDSRHWEEHISDLAERYGVEEELVRAVIRMESGGKTNAVSSKGAMGLMQIMPGTAKMLGVDDPFDPVQNLEGGIKYLSQLSDKYEGDLEKTLAAYNAGPGRVDSYGGVPPFTETENYVKNVLAQYRKNSGSGE